MYQQAHIYVTTKGLERHKYTYVTRKRTKCVKNMYVAKTKHELVYVCKKDINLNIYRYVKRQIQA